MSTDNSKTDVGFNQQTRVLSGAISINYGSEELGSNATTFDNFAITNDKILMNHNDNTSSKMFTLEGNCPDKGEQTTVDPTDKKDNCLASGRALIDANHYTTGCISNVLSSSTSTSTIKGDTYIDNSTTNVYHYSFVDVPYICINFEPKCDLKGWHIIGDETLDEYPTAVQLKITMSNNAGATTVEKVNIIDINNVDCRIDFAKYKNVSTIFKNTTKIETFILAWNKPNCLAKLYRNYNSFVENYSANQLKEFEVIEELINSNGAVKYGIVSNSMTATMLNDEDRKFDCGRLRDQVQLNKRISPYISAQSNDTMHEYCLGIYYIKEWNIAQDDMWVTVKASDKLIDLQSMTYWGRKPVNKNPQFTGYVRATGEVNNSFYELFTDIIACVNNRLVVKLKSTIDESLKLIGVDFPYIDKVTCWQAMQLLCDASLSHAYLDRANNLVITTDYIQPTVTADTTTHPPVGLASTNLIVNPSNCFNYNIPHYENAVITSVDIAYHKAKKSQEAETIIVFTITKEQSGKLTTLEFDGLYEDIIKLELTDSYGILGNVDYNNFSITFTPLIPDNSQDVSFDFILQGIKVSFDKHSLTNLSSSDVTYDSNLYKHADSHLITTEDRAKLLAGRLAGIHGGKGKYLSTTWRGNPLLENRRTFEGQGRFYIQPANDESATNIANHAINESNETDIHKDTFECVGLTTRYDGGLQQDIKAVSYNNNNTILTN